MLRQYYILSILSFLLLMAGACQKDSGVVAWVDEAPITSSEMDYWMLLNKAEVYRHFYQEYGINDSDTFWLSTYGGKQPTEMLKTRALYEARRCKVQQLLALQKGVSTEINFDSIVANLEQENIRRAEKVRRGEPIYGPKKFTVRTYFASEHDKMVYALKDKLAEQELKPTQREMELLRSNNKVSGSDRDLFFTMQFVDENYDAYIDSVTRSSTIIINEKIWKSIEL